VAAEFPLQRCHRPLPTQEVAASGRQGEQSPGHSPHLPAADIHYAMREGAKKTVILGRLSGRRWRFAEDLGRRGGRSTLNESLKESKDQPARGQGSVTLTAWEAYSTIARLEGLYQY
jgi:hypothetical protein